MTSCVIEKDKLVSVSAFDRTISILSFASLLSGQGDDDEEEEIRGAAESSMEGSMRMSGVDAFLPLSFFQQCEEILLSPTGGNKVNNVLLITSKFASPPTPIALKGIDGHIHIHRSLSSWESPAKNKNGKVLDLPVTFHSKVRSSGYGQTPNSVLGRMEQKRKERIMRERAKREEEDSGGRGGGRCEDHGCILERSASVSASRARATGAAGVFVSATKSGNEEGRKTTSTSSSSRPALGRRLRIYPRDSPAPTNRLHHLAYRGAAGGGLDKDQGQGAALHRVSFSEDGSALAIVSASSDSHFSFSTVKMPSLPAASGLGGVGAEVSYMGHDDRVNSVQFSHNKQMLISGSDDGSARIWSVGTVDHAALVITHDRGSGGGTLSLRSGKLEKDVSTLNRNRPFGRGVDEASFFYQDKIVVLVSIII